MGTYDNKAAAPGSGYGQDQKPKRKLSKQQQEDLVKEVRDCIDSAWEHERINIQEATLDQRFRANDQWPHASRTQRERDGRPVLTFNRLNQFVHQVCNPMRQADKSIKATADDDAPDPGMAKVVDGIFRKILRQSKAHSVFAHQLDCQAGCGIGWVRICNDYKDDKSFDQEIYVEKVHNPLSVFWDPAACDPVKSDAMWMVVTEMIPEATFKARYPDAAEDNVDDPQSLGNYYSVTEGGFYWRTDKDVRIAEYYKKIPTKRTLAKLANGQTEDVTDKPPQLLKMLPIAATRQVNTFRVEKYIVSGSEVIEGPYDVPGSYIPLVPAVGGEVALDQGTYRYSVIRFARDAQQMYNLNRTAMSEWIGQAPVAPYMVTPKMIAAHRGIWDSHNVNRRNYLPYTPDKDAPGMRPERIDPPAAPTALAADAQFAADDMKYGAGIHDASLGAPSKEVSGVALARKQMESDVGSYHFADNFEATLLHIGCILLEWIPVVYDTPRQVNLVAPDGSEIPTPINTPQMDPQTGQWVIVNDLSSARFLVDAKIGPNYSSRRIEMQGEIGEFIKALPPQQAAVITDIFARNQDWEGHEEIANRLRATIPPQILQASQVGPDGQPIPPPPPPPDPMLEAKLREIASNIEKNMATTAKTIVEAKQLDRMDAIVDYPMQPGQAPAPGQPPPGGPPQGPPFQQ